MASPTDDAKVIADVKASIEAEMPAVKIIDKIIKEIQGKAK